MATKKDLHNGCYFSCKGSILRLMDKIEAFKFRNPDALIQAIGHAASTAAMIGGVSSMTGVGTLGRLDWDFEFRVGN